MVVDDLKSYKGSPIVLYGGSPNINNLHMFLVHDREEYDHNIDIIRHEWGVIDFSTAFLNYYDFRAFVTTVTLKSGAEHFLIFVKEKELSDIGTISHECIHLMSKIFKSRGIDYDIDNDEFMTYFYEWVITTVINSLSSIAEEKKGNNNNGKHIRRKK